MGRRAGRTQAFQDCLFSNLCLLLGLLRAHLRHGSLWNHQAWILKARLYLSQEEQNLSQEEQNLMMSLDHTLNLTFYMKTSYKCLPFFFLLFLKTTLQVGSARPCFLYKRSSFYLCM